MIDKNRNKIIAGNIKKYISQEKITQKQLAESIGLSPSTMSDYMNLRSNPSHGVIQKIADYFGVLKSDIDTTYKELNDITTIYNQLEQPRQQKVYKYAKNQLDDQNKVVEFATKETQQSYTVDCYGAVSAGTGEWLDQEQVTEVDYYGEVPAHDFAVTVNGDSMLPMFEDGQLIFVDEEHEARSGQVIIAQLNGESYVKKLVIDSNGYRLVSLNKAYEDIILQESDDFNIFGVVVL